MSLTKCPKCGGNTMFVQTPGRYEAHYMSVQKPVRGRLKAECQADCDQLFWWFPWSRRITRRTKP